MEATALFVTAFIIGLSGAMLPGPLLTTAIAETIRRGFRAGPQIALGHAILELVLVLALLTGLVSFLARTDVTMVVAILGGIFLLLMGAALLRDAWGNRISLQEIDGLLPGSFRLHPILAGITVSLANPMWILWWATVGLSYITMAIKSGSIGLISFFTGHVSADLAWYSLVSLGVAGGRRFLNQKVYNAVLFVCGLFLLAVGLHFIYTGLITG